MLLKGRALFGDCLTLVGLVDVAGKLPVVDNKLPSLLSPGGAIMRLNKDTKGPCK